MSIIKSEELSFRYNAASSLALDNINLSVEEGECILLCGKSGCGKTSFSRLLNGLSPNFFKGELNGHIESVGLDQSYEIEEYVPLVGSVFQNPKTQYFNINTTSELAFPCENMGYSSEMIIKRVYECAREFKLESLLDRNIFKLSGGEKQQIAFGAATILKPKLLVLDEPSSNLDAEAIKRLRQMIIKMKALKITIVIAEHRLAWLSDIIDRACYFDNGKLVKIYTNQEFNNLDEKTLYALGLRSLDLTKFKSEIDAKTNLKTSLKPMIEVHDLKIGHDKNHYVRTIDDFSLARGEILGLMGLNGTGKSTFAKTLCGLLKPLEGKILVDNQAVKTKDLMRMSFLVMQDVNYQLFADSVYEEVLLGSSDTSKLDEVLDSLGLLDIKERHPMSLSGGQKQRTAVASAILSGKEVIILDEPTSGLDHYHMQQLGTLLEMLKKQNKAVIVITHDEELAADYCDRIVLLKEN